MYRFLPKQLPILLFFWSMYLWCLWGHYPAITPKYLISTSVTWSIGLISTRNNHAIWKPQMVWKMHQKRSQRVKNSKISCGVGTPPDPPTGSTAMHSPLAPPPPKFSVLFYPPSSIFLNETLSKQLCTSVCRCVCGLIVILWSVVKVLFPSLPSLQSFCEGMGSGEGSPPPSAVW